MAEWIVAGDWQLKQDAVPTLAYIAGYGRSGSTLLDIMLGSHPQILSLGEAGSVWDLINRQGDCTCGSAFSLCPVWGPALFQADEARSRSGHVQRQSVSIEGWLRGLFSVKNRQVGRVDAYVTTWLRIATELGKATGARVLVDSSKTSYRFLWRPNALYRHVGLDVRMIHLIRDPRAVVASCLMGQNSRLAVGDRSRRPFTASIAVLGWIVANLGARMNARLLGADRYHLVLFEQLTQDPEGTMQELAEFLGVDLTPVSQRIADGEDFPVGHLVAGNRMAQAGSVTPNAQRGVPYQLGFAQRFICKVLAMPIYRVLTKTGRPPISASVEKIH